MLVTWILQHHMSTYLENVTLGMSYSLCLESDREDSTRRNCRRCIAAPVLTLATNKSVSDHKRLELSQTDFAYIKCVLILVAIKLRNRPTVIPSITTDEDFLIYM
ncbi:hypothetical protein ScPMuIL_017098 [Solemya velum]